MTPEPTVQDETADNSDDSRPIASSVTTPINKSANTTRVRRPPGRRELEDHTRNAD